MESNSIELKIISSKDLKSFNFFQKLLIYVRVSIISNYSKIPYQRTETDKEGDGNPEWNQEIRLDLREISFENCDDCFLHFDLFHEGLMFGDKEIGQVRVPIKDLVEDYGGGTRFVSYQVDSVDGKPNGVLNFSYKLNGKTTNSSINPIDTYSVFHHHDHQSSSANLYPASGIHSSGVPSEVYYHPPPPPPPPPPMVYGAYYHYHHHHHPAGVHGWRPDPYGFSSGFDYYSMQMTHGPASGGPVYGSDHDPSFIWNGR